MNYLAIDEADFANGQGVRVVLWVAGCTHHCEGCHNPQTHDFNAGKQIDTYTLFELNTLLSKPYIKGLTITGGDPLAKPNRKATEYICQWLRFVNDRPIDFWIYTGHTYEALEDEIDLSFADYLVDGRFVKSLKQPLAFRGSSNQRIIDIKASIKEGKVVCCDFDN